MDGCVAVGGARGLVAAGCVVWVVLLAAASGTTVARTTLVPAGEVAMSLSILL